MHKTTFQSYPNVLSRTIYIGLSRQCTISFQQDFGKSRLKKGIEYSERPHVSFERATTVFYTYYG